MTDGVLNKLVKHPSYRSTPIAPKYPRKALRKKQEGEVIIRVLVSASGRNLELKIHKSSGIKSLDDAALKAVKGWEIEPATLEGRGVSAWVEVPVIFKLSR